MSARRLYVGVRLSEAGLTAVDSLAASSGVTRSEMIRSLLGEAIAARQSREARPVPKQLSP